MNYLFILLIVVVWMLPSSLLLAGTNIENGKKIFNSKCIACHTIGQGKRLGPDLKGVTKRRKVAWLKKMIQEPDKFVKTDPIAKKLFKEYNNLPMVNYGLKDAQVNDIISYLKSTVGGEKKKKSKKNQ